jgi:gluconolactonase
VLAWGLAPALVLGVGGQDGAGRDRAAQGRPAQERTPLPKQLVAPDISGVIAGGTPIQLVRDGFNGQEGPVGTADGGILFTETDADRIVKIGPDDSSSIYIEHAGGHPRGLTYDTRGRLVATLATGGALMELAPVHQPLVDSFGGQPLGYPNDLVADTKGGIYFTDPVDSPALHDFRSPPPNRKNMVFYLRPDGQVISVTDEVRPNGVQLSPDEKLLYVTNQRTIDKFDVQPDGTVRNHRTFVVSGGDGLIIDSAGRLYAAAQGVQVFSPEGEHLGTIPCGAGPANMVFSGPDKKTLYMVGGSAVYKVRILAQGLPNRAR